MNECGQIIRTIAAVRLKMKIHTRVRDGEFGSEILSEKIFAEGNKANKDCSVPKNRFVTFVSFCYHLSQIENAEGDESPLQ